MAVNDLIQIRKGTSAAWTSANPVLASGEPGYDTTNNILKIGDGSTAWNSLSSHKHSAADISDFNSSVSGLLPVKNIVAGNNITISSSSGIYTINSTASGGSSTSVIEYNNVSNFPSSGVGSTVYISTDTGRIYRWAGSVYQELGPVSYAPIGSDSRWDLFLPTAPTVVSATAGNARATLSWTTPTVLSQTPITDYAVQYSSNSGLSWVAFARPVSTGTSATVTGLINGTSYTFRVASVNGIGTGSYSTASSFVTPTSGDIYWSNVQLLVPGDTSTADFSSYSRSVTTGGSVTFSTAQKKWGAGSILFSSSTSDYLQLADLDALELLSGDFAIEMWIRTTASTQYTTIISRTPVSFTSGCWSLMINQSASGSGNIAVYIGDITTSVPVLTSSGANIRDGSWHHLVFSRSGSTFSLYFDGSRVATATSSATISNISGGIRIGADQYYGRYFDGNIDDLRITIGSSRGYTGSTITVPTAAFPNS